MKVLDARLCLTLCDPMDCTPPGSSVHGILHGKDTGVGSQPLLQGIFQNQKSNPNLLHCRQILYHLSHQGSPISIRGLPTMWVIQLAQKSEGGTMW